MAEVVRREAGKTRGQYFWLTAAIAAGLDASLALLVVGGIAVLLAGDVLSMLVAFYGVAWATGTIAARLRV